MAGMYSGMKYKMAMVNGLIGMGLYADGNSEDIYQQLRKHNTLRSCMFIRSKVKELMQFRRIKILLIG